MLGDVGVDVRDVIDRSPRDEHALRRGSQPKRVGTQEGRTPRGSQPKVFAPKRVATQGGRTYDPLSTGIIREAASRAW